MLLRTVLAVFFAVIPILAQNSGPFLPGNILPVHAASRRTAVSQEIGFAPGSLCDVTTRGLYLPNGELSDGEKLRLQFRGSGTADARDLTIVAQLSPFDFTVLIPADAPVGEAEIVALAESGRVFRSTVWIAASGFGMFTKLRQGYDAADAQVWRDGPRPVALATPVRAAEWVTIWGTGLGSATPVVEVAGIAVVPSYAGPAPGLTGVDQINFQFPAGVPDDCYIPLAVKVDGRVAHTTSIAAASGSGPCRHRLGLSAADLATLDQGDSVPISQSWVHSDVLPSPEMDGTYRRYDVASLDFMYVDAPRLQVITGLLEAPKPGCQLNLAGAIGGIFAFARAFALDSGTPAVTGPGGVRIPMEGILGHFSTPVVEVSYPLDKIPPSSFTAGEWSVTSPGGRNVGEFQAGLRIPPPLQWTNRASVSPVSRARNLVLTWNAAGYSEREWMQGNIGIGAGYIGCQAPATAGSITIPASMLAQLPDAKGSRPQVQLLLTPSRENPVLYPVPLVGGGSFPGVATFSYLEAVTVDLQ